MRKEGAANTLLFQNREKLPVKERDQDAAALWENITFSSHIVMEDREDGNRK
ncbi:hypothetical protein [Bacillus sp. LR_5]|uniref:hypothetical protein n=1 Tax=Bacillus sp. LR_5 TaxID=3055784 RepID=UPI0036608829